MSGLGLVLSIAKDALASQTYGMSVTGHNIANVSTEGYSRQRAVQESNEPAPYGGVLLGRGVNTTQVLRISDQFIEKQLMERKSNMLASEGMENYMQIMEGLFSESGEMSISRILSDFWNMWHDISNNPSGTPERIALYEHSTLLAEQFNALSDDLIALQTDLTSAVSTGIETVNQITAEIGQINDQIAGMETTGAANDLRDKRNTLVSELSEYVDVKTFEQSNSTLTVVTAKGCVLVSGITSYDLQLSNATDIEWVGSGGNRVEITDYMTNGKIGGWLDMRDSVVEKYKLDLDAMAKEFVWAINRQHSQGAGLEAFSTVTGTYQATDTTAALDSSGLTFEDEIVDGGFRLWLYDSSGAYVSDKTITVDADVTALDDGAARDIVSQITSMHAEISATISDSKLNIAASNGYQFAFSDDTSNVLAALGINTFLTNSTAGGMGVNDGIGLNKNLIAAAQVTNNVGPAIADSGNAGAGTIVTSGHYTGTTDATYTIEILATGDETAATFRWSDDGGSTWTGSVTADYPTAQALGGDGVSVTFLPDTYTAGDTFTIGVTADSNSHGTSAAGDNTNALAIADLQYTSTTISQWTCDRINAPTEGSVNATFEDYYHSMVGSIGIKASSISRSRGFHEMMMQTLSETRDSISAVSLDEEMTLLMKFQQAYSAAAKLISIADEMMNTLLSVK